MMSEDGEEGAIELELMEEKKGGGEEANAAGQVGIEVNFSMDDDEDEMVEEEAGEEAAGGALEAQKSQWQRTWDLVTSPWTRLSKRVKTVIILVITGVIIFALVLAIFVPYLWTESVTREYFIQAELVDAWDYAPSGRNLVTDQAFGKEANVYMAQSNATIGRVYRKANFVGYTNASFTERLALPSDHLGLLGPVIRASVGETVRITVRNQLDFPISFFASGLELAKVAEGAAYNDNHSGDKGGLISTGRNYTYVINLSELDGPASNDFSSVAYAYYSHIDSVQEFNSGLAGVIVVCENGKADEDAIPTDVDSEVFLMPVVMDENQSPFLDENMDTYLLTEQPIDLAARTALKEDPAFIESNTMHCINGYMFGNLPNVTISVGKRSRWYILGLGEGTHTIIWSGQTLVSESERIGSILSYPGTTTVADLEPLQTGTWLIEAYGRDGRVGMTALYDVV